MEWFTPDPTNRRGREGPVEALENIALPIAIVLWLFIAVRHRSQRASGLAAAGMVAQLAFIFGEEIDWGQTIDLRPLGGWRNFRTTLRAAGILQRWDDAIAPTAYLLAFMCAPLAPIRGVRRWLDSMAPVRAQIGDGIAIIVLPPTWAVVTHFVVPLTSVEVIQVCTYAVVLNVGARVLRSRAPTVV
jgi:hypothetical protein